MFRYRRYRVFVVFAVVTVFALYQFGSTSSWRQAALLPSTEKPAAPAEVVPEGHGDVPHLSWEPRPHEVVKETKKLVGELSDLVTSLSQPLETPPPIASVSHPAQKPPPGTPKQLPKTKGEKLAPYTEKPVGTGTPVGIGHLENDPKPTSPGGGVLHEHPEGKLEVAPLPTETEVIHWQPRSEHFPVPSKSIIQLPSGKPAPIPKIQFEFKEETPEAKADRLSKLKVIKTEFMRSWNGYKEKAWMKDEVMPVSGEFKNGFNGWGATLVDSLDTLWMMGLKTEFEEAVEAVKKIDFTTTPRADIPLFETTIRYLGGLVAAYDISDKKYSILLGKAVELAEILMGAFDTPNRMPITYYYWRPTSASQPHRASNRVVLAEIGSLSVEFTRLAQLTGEGKYYDAIARITNALETFQNETSLPGMWPTYIDASGCKKPPVTYTVEKQDTLDDTDDGPLAAVSLANSTAAAPASESPDTFDENEMIPLELPKPIEFVAVEKENEDKKSQAKKRRQLEEPDATLAEHVVAKTAKVAASTSTLAAPKCEEQGLTSNGQGDYTLGGMSDSTYEYLPKQYLLLNGLVDQYRTMYEKSADVVKKNLIFRPMLPNNDDILFSGKVTVFTADDIPNDLAFENAHLTCFAGGMFALGAKIFNREDDLEIAKKLTEGCVWSYNSTSTGIMPESFFVVGCEDQKSCTWNQTKYYESLDPHAEYRLNTYKEQMESYEEQLAEASSSYAEAMMAATGAPQAKASGLVEKAVESEPLPAEAEPTEEPIAVGVGKRQLDPADEPAEKPSKTNKKTDGEPLMEKRPMTEKFPVLEDSNDEESEERAAPAKTENPPSPTLPTFPNIYSPRAPLSHEEYVQNRIQEERLPEGVTNIQSKHYILRPEAIESVFYLYRITGSQHWRDVGWTMYQSITLHTAAEFGNSAIDDVTKSAPQMKDSMESFWLAETLKYFYLLFEEESAVSLDDWVLNTEAHPFRRGK